MSRLLVECGEALYGPRWQSELVRDLDKRYRWDLLYLSRLKIGDGVGTHGDVNLYANDPRCD